MRKGMISSIVIILSLIVSSGCVIIDPGDGDAEGTEEKEVREMTARDEEVFRSYGLTEERIAKMKKEGLNYSEQSFVDTAIMMLDYLTEKYNEEFVVVGGDIPDLLSKEYYIVAKAVTGEYKGIEFVVNYYGEAGYSDGYMGLVKGAQVRGLVKNLFDEKYTDTTIYIESDGEYIGDVSLDTSPEIAMKEMDFFSFVLINNPKMTHDDYLKRVREIEILMNEYEISGRVRIFCVSEKVDEELAIDDLVQILFKNGDSKPIIVWHGESVVVR